MTNFSATIMSRRATFLVKPHGDRLRGSEAGLGDDFGSPVHPLDPADVVVGYSLFDLAVEMLHVRDVIRVLHVKQKMQNRFMLFEIGVEALGDG